MRNSVDGWPGRTHALVDDWTKGGRRRKLRYVPVGTLLTDLPQVSLEQPVHHELTLESTMGIIWTIIIGFLAGLIARWIHPGVSNEPSGFVLTTLLGIAGAFVATFLGQAIG